MKSCSRECRASSPPPPPLARSFLGFSPRRSIHSVTSIALQRPWRTRGGDLHCKALPAERILPVATPYQSREGGEGCTKGSKGKKGSLALDQLPYPSCSHLLSTCVVRMRLLAVETRPPYARPPSFQSPLYFPFSPSYFSPDDPRLRLAEIVTPPSNDDSSFFVFNFVTRNISTRRFERNKV